MDVLDNVASDGGGLGLDLTYGYIHEGRFDHNHATSGSGGAISQRDYSLDIWDSTLSGNAATYYGGGIYSTGWLDLTSSEVTDNQAVYGGGVWANATWILESNIQDNVAEQDGGGVFLNYGLLSTSTLRGNRSVSGRGGGVFAGGTSWIHLEHVLLDASSAVDGGAVSTQALGFVLLEDNTLVANQASGNGGGVHATGRVYFDDIVRIEMNSAGELGGGLYTEHDLYISYLDSLDIERNTAALGGGGIYSSGPWLELEDADFYANHATGGPGGAILFEGVEAELRRVDLRENTATHGAGLAIRGGQTNVIRSSIYDNEADKEGGGFHAADGTLMVLNSTLSGNSAPAGGGAVHSTHTAKVGLAHCTVSENIGDVGGIAGQPANAPVDVYNVVLDDNFDLSGTEWNCDKGVVTHGHNVIDDPATYCADPTRDYNTGASLQPRTTLLDAAGQPVPGRTTYAPTAGTKVVDNAEDGYCLGYWEIDPDPLMVARVSHGGGSVRDIGANELP